MEGVVRYLYGFPLETLETLDACQFIALYKCANELSIPILQETAKEMLEPCLRKLVTDNRLHKELVMIWQSFQSHPYDGVLRASRNALIKICCKNWKALEGMLVIRTIQTKDQFFFEDMLKYIASQRGGELL